MQVWEDQIQGVVVNNSALVVDPWCLIVGSEMGYSDLDDIYRFI
jgi:hypothetical protein